jgi:hypothetical protein
MSSFALSALFKKTFSKRSKLLFTHQMKKKILEKFKQLSLREISALQNLFDCNIRINFMIILPNDIK